MTDLKLFNFFKQRNKPKLGLALSGGASRGLAHIGVLHAFEEFGYPIHAICGVSSGSLIGGLYAAGMSISSIIDHLPKLNWRSFTSFHLSKRGMVSSIRIQLFIEKHVGKILLKDCAIPFSAVATNLETAQSVVFDDPNDSLSEVIRASCSFPGVFSPVKIKETYYVDGGIFQHLPVKPLTDQGIQHVVGVDVIPSCSLDVPPSNIPLILDRSLDLMLHTQVNDSINQPTVLLRPIVRQFSSFDIKEFHQLIELGYQSVKNNRDNIEAII